MKLFPFSLFILVTGLAAQSASAAAIMERRLWIETAIDTIKDDMCADKMKTWRCLFAEKTECTKVMREAFAVCAGKVLPDLPEYIQDEASKAEANRVVTTCLTEEVTKKYIIPLPHEKMDEYNVCNGSVPRAKTFSPNLQRALEFSKTQTTSACANGSFYRKCYNIPDKICSDLVAKHQQDCTQKMENDGVSVKKEDAAVQEAGRKITDCTLGNLRKDLDSSRKRIQSKDCD